MSFAQRIDIWRTLTARPADLADEVPGPAELRGELETILAEVQKTRATCRRRSSQQLHRFGLKPRRGRRPEKPVVGARRSIPL